MVPGNVAMIQQHMMMTGMTPGMPGNPNAFLAFPQLYHQAAAGYSGASATAAASSQRRAARTQEKVNRGANANVGRGPGGRNKRMTKEKDVPVVTPLYKTRLCNFHLVGACQKGSSCSYAHGEEDLRPSPDFERTSVCPIMLNHGQCDKLNCRYAHNANELRTAPGLLKTKMCSFHVNGLCVVGQACRFAHSQEELEEALEVQKEAALPLTNTSPPRPNAELWEMRRTAFVMPRSKAEALENYKLPLESDKLQLPIENVPQPQTPPASEADDTHHADAAAGVSPKLPQQASFHIKSEPFSVKTESRRRASEGAEVSFDVKSQPRREQKVAPLKNMKSPKINPQRQEPQVPMFSLMDRAEAEKEVKVNVVMRGQVDVEAPAQVVRGKVIVDIEDDDIPVPMLALTEKEYPRLPPPEKEKMQRPVKSEMEPMAQQAIASSSSAAAIPPPPAPLAMRGRSAQKIRDSRSSKHDIQQERQPTGPRVVVDIEDFSAIDDVYVSEERQRTNSADPPLVELRRKGPDGSITTELYHSDCTRENRCIIPKDKSAACSVAGRFAECAMCPRAKGQMMQTGCSSHDTTRRGGCAACSCGLKVVTRNSFLTVLGSDLINEDDEEVKPGARRRAWSE